MPSGSDHPALGPVWSVCCHLRHCPLQDVQAEEPAQPQALGMARGAGSPASCDTCSVQALPGSLKSCQLSAPSFLSFKQFHQEFG